MVYEWPQKARAFLDAVEKGQKEREIEKRAKAEAEEFEKIADALRGEIGVGPRHPDKMERIVRFKGKLYRFFWNEDAKEARWTGIPVEELGE